jgi:hypothetical protein
MVCVAAFVILLLLSVPVLVLALIGKRNEKVAKFTAPYFKMFKKSWYCVGKRVTLQKCESSFKDDIKHSLLKRVIIKRPKLVKPISVTIEIAAVLIVIVAAWSLLTVVKGGMALAVLGTCDVASPSSCSLNPNEACSIDQDRPGFWESARTWRLPEYYANWFGDFGTIFAAIPNRFRNWDPAEFKPENATFARPYNADLPMALEIIDPGCMICRQSFINIKNSDFLERYNLTYLAYPIPSSTGEGYKFANSGLITQYLEAVRIVEVQGDHVTTDWKIIERLFTGFDDRNRQFQSAFNSSYDSDEAERVLQSWLRDFGYSDEEVQQVVDLAHSDRVAEIMAANRDIVDNQIRTKRIPTFIFDGRKRDGLLTP